MESFKLRVIGVIMKNKDFSLEFRHELVTSLLTKFLEFPKSWSYLDITHVVFDEVFKAVKWNDLESESHDFLHEIIDLCLDGRFKPEEKKGSCFSDLCNCESSFGKEFGCHWSSYRPPHYVGRLNQYKFCFKNSLRDFVCTCDDSSDMESLDGLVSGVIGKPPRARAMRPAPKDSAPLGSLPYGIPSGLKTSKCLESPSSKIIPELDGDSDEELSMPKLIRVKPAFETIAPGSPSLIQGPSMMMQFSPFSINFRFASPPRSLTISQVFESANKHMDQASSVGGVGGGASSSGSLDDSSGGSMGGGASSSGFKRSFNLEFGMSSPPPKKI